jgi:hypothetical protein
VSSVANKPEEIFIEIVPRPVVGTGVRFNA